MKNRGEMSEKLPATGRFRQIFLIERATVTYALIWKTINFFCLFLKTPKKRKGAFWNLPLYSTFREKKYIYFCLVASILNHIDWWHLSYTPITKQTKWKNNKEWNFPFPLSLLKIQKRNHTSNPERERKNGRERKNKKPRKTWPLTVPVRPRHFSSNLPLSISIPPLSCCCPVSHTLFANRPHLGNLNPSDGFLFVLHES